MLKTSTLRPGLLVSLHTAVVGNVSYVRLDIQAEHITEDGSKRAVWETSKTVDDPTEHEAALKVQGKAGSLIRGVCARSRHGLLCPDNKIAELEAAITEAERLAEAFNASAKMTRVDVSVVTGRMERDDARAMRNINAEVRLLLDAMAQGVRSLDVERIRDAATRAKQLGSMLTPEAAKSCEEAIDAVRRTAREIVKAGETAGLEVDSLALKRINEARTAFLDLDDAREMATPAAESRALDLEPETIPEISEPATRQAAGTSQFGMEF
jgi:hypothetical protein